MKYRGTLLAILAITVATAYLAAMFMATDGHAVPQVVDLYVVLQYARSIGEGHAFHYNPGDPATTGSTSLLYTLVLGVLAKAGVAGDWMVGAAIAIGAVCYLGSVLVAQRIGQRLGDDRTALYAGLLVALGGPVVWGFFYGSDLGPFAFLVLLLLNQLLGDAHLPAPRAGTILVLCLLVLARPEGFVIAVLICLSLALRSSQHLRDWARLLIPVGVGIVVLMFYKWLTGSWIGTSIEDKSLSANYSSADAVALTVEYLVDIVRGLLLGFYPGQTPIGFSRGWANVFFPPLGLLVVWLGYDSLADPRLKSPVRSWLIAVSGAALVSVPNMYMGVHFQRYVLWLLPGLLVLLARGVTVDSAHPRLFGKALRFYTCLALVLSVLATARFAALYGELAGTTYRRDYAMAQWIRAAIADHRLPPKPIIANLATSIEFLTGHHAVNLHGVTAPDFIGVRKAEREPSVLEILTRLSADQRPAYLLTSSDAQAAYPSMLALVVEPPLHQTTSLAGDELLLFATHYESLGARQTMHDPASLATVSGLRLVDELNVCDPSSETAHSYRFRSRMGDLLLNGAVHSDRYHVEGDAALELMDGGRLIVGEEVFTVATEPGKPLVIVARMAASNDVGLLRASGASRRSVVLRSANLNVSVGGAAAQRWATRLQDGWSEPVIRIPGDLVKTNRTALRLAGFYPSYQYWFFQ